MGTQNLSIERDNGVEAHSIKDRRSNTARAVLALESFYKWTLTGTPLQNRVGELYSLVGSIAFLFIFSRWYVKKGPLMHKCAHIFDLVTRLRQAVNHPYLVVYSPANSLRSESIANSDNGEQACGLCHDPVEDAVYGVQEAKTSVNGFRSSSILNRIRLDDFQTSTKIDALVSLFQLKP
ncbi:hypothetical protein Cgig2_022168 [Carnegiea gigantea]|uniref:SNF2 N-terminal domain-containing protein n=1 Tax=Carnegiea gigantea TaxID=171969 RepID=A0A9Q1GS71_9CARY|nr:hypothetical protein Cgig2_016946 [Carnegiea gigantea]KAJ8424589.1 hypothetical protein Cgig2_022167 [Carnegiea gigantea]KAJ8424590.1 hypothetical protein Cgig2_022168 [Carnegiea gigantea]